MDFPIYLAMTASELANCCQLPEKIAWMACHFSPYGTGLSNLPNHIPDGSIIILNDRIPLCGHDPCHIVRQLTEIVQQHKAFGVLIDFQRPVSSESLAVVEQLNLLTCPAAITETYAQYSSLAVFLSSPAPHISVKDHIIPWKDRDIWLELSLEPEIIRLSKDKAVKLPGCKNQSSSTQLQDADLCCHYQISIDTEYADFSVYRTKEDLNNFIKQVSALPIRMGIGLYQELRDVLL